MKLQQQDFVAAERIQQELLRRLPGDPVLAEFSKYLPREVQAQKTAANDYGDEYYDDEAPATKEEEEAYGKEEEEEEPETEVVVEESKTDDAPKKEGDESEYEDEDEGYGEEDYDDEGKYKWGNEGGDWDWYYREDKEAYERGDMMPNTLNPPVYLDKATIDRALAQKQQVDSQDPTKENTAGNAVYRTNNRKKPAAVVQNPDSTGEWKY